MDGYGGFMKPSFHDPMRAKRSGHFPSGKVRLISKNCSDTNYHASAVKMDRVQHGETLKQPRAKLGPMHTHPSLEVTLLTRQTVHPSAMLSLNVASIPDIGSLLVLDGHSSPAHPMGISLTSSYPVNTHRPTSFKGSINLTIN